MDHDPVLDAVGPRLRSIRQRRGATLAELCEATGISVSTLSRLESGGRRPTLELLLALARAHQVPLDELVGAPFGPNYSLFGGRHDFRVPRRHRTVNHG